MEEAPNQINKRESAISLNMVISNIWNYLTYVIIGS